MLEHSNRQAARAPKIEVLGPRTMCATATATDDKESVSGGGEHRALRGRNGWSYYVFRQGFRMHLTGSSFRGQC